MCLIWSALIQLDTRTNIEEKTWLESELTGLHHVLWREKSHCVCFRWSWWYCLNYQLRRDGKRVKTQGEKTLHHKFSVIQFQKQARCDTRRESPTFLIAPARKQEPVTAYERHHGQHYQARPPNQLLVLQSHITRHDLLSKTTRYALKYNCLFPLFLCFVLLRC